MLLINVHSSTIYNIVFSTFFAKVVPLNDFYRHPETNNLYTKECKYIGRYNELDYED
uniref:Uncharacterized protein n=1 Tax=viral metagenome TaxID=1070528 RepID=A0A6C0IG67_9ZZZZ